MAKLLKWQKSAFNTKTDAKKLKLAVADFRKNPKPFIIRPEIVDYAWGGKKFIAKLLKKKNPKNEPWAELWIGAHPKFPAMVKIKNTDVNLNELIVDAADLILGKKIAKEFDSKLPYLMKVLVAGDTLSIQAHPSKAQAQAGFREEFKTGVPLTAYDRNYRDPNHKPEFAYALTDFWVTCGFRPIVEIVENFEKLNILEFKNNLENLKKSLSENKAAQKTALKKFYTAIMQDERNLKEAQARLERKKDNANDQKITQKAQTRIDKIISGVVKKIRSQICPQLELKNDAKYQKIIEAAEKKKKANVFIKELWLLRMKEQYQNDIGSLSPYLLNLFCLKKGEGIFLEAGELHCYLGKLNPKQNYDNAIIEVMANSDNVLRGGLTPKHVAVAELIKILSFKSEKPKIFIPVRKTSQEKFYKFPAPEFNVAEIKLPSGKKYPVAKIHSADSYLVYQGQVEIIDSKNNILRTKKGQSFLVPAVIGHYQINALAKTILYKTSTII